jgi:hypothetical protein
MHAREITNQVLVDLLARLGFEQFKAIPPNCVVWRHASADCAIVLPENKRLEKARPADVAGVETQLRYHGFLESSDFDAMLSAASNA